MARDPLDTTIMNNIFYANDAAVERGGIESDKVYYNDFYNNTVNFVNYPPSYGDMLITNANGYSCDLGFNIFLDPLLSGDQLHIEPISPCIDAGTASEATDNDIDGQSRPFGPKYDIGVDEVHPSPLDNSTPQFTK
jgi:hypothetical protein